MTFLFDPPLAGSQSTDGAPLSAAGTGSVSELVFTQTVTGQYLSFYWQGAEPAGLDVQQVVSSPWGTSFAPVAIAPYLQQVCQVVESQVPQAYTCPFHYGEQNWLFELLLSPVLTPQGAVKAVLVMGQQVSPPATRAETDQPHREDTPPISQPAIQEISCGSAAVSLADLFQASLENACDRPLDLPDLTHLSHLSRTIRRTLNLDTIWQQAVQGLGTLFGAQRCWIGPYCLGQAALPVMAEFLCDDHPSRLGQTLSLSEFPGCTDLLNPQAAIASVPSPWFLSPPASSPSPSPGNPSLETLVIATCYQNQPNGLIVLERHTPWTTIEISAIRELADDLGPAIAHATLLTESQSLTHKLQQAHYTLIQKHQELEEAHQRAEEVSRFKSEFLANTSHELRTPLNAMIGFLKLVIDGVADDPQEEAEFIQEAYRSALHLLNIINDILDIAKIEAGKLQIEPSPVPLKELFADVAKFTQTQAQQKNLNFQILTPNTRDEIILYGNYQRLLQVMLNLVGNALKFTHEGSITISAEVVKKKVLPPQQEVPSMVKIRVADTGIGVSLDKLDKLFSAFYQVDGARTRQYGGTGLGLTISQKLVEEMGGEVNFFSMGEGLGSTVTFTVPLFQEPVL